MTLSEIGHHHLDKWWENVGPGCAKYSKIPSSQSSQPTRRNAGSLIHTLKTLIFDTSGHPDELAIGFRNNCLFLQGLAKKNVLAMG